MSNLPLRQRIRTPLRVQAEKRATKARKHIHRLRGERMRDKIYNFVDARQRGGFSPPTVREIMEEVGLSTTSAVAYHLKILADEGRLDRDPGKARGTHLAPGYEAHASAHVAQGATFEDTRNNLLSYFIAVDDPRALSHWEIRCVAWDEIPYLAEAIAKHAQGVFEARKQRSRYESE